MSLVKLALNNLATDLKAEVPLSLESSDLKRQNLTSHKK